MFGLSDSATQAIHLKNFVEKQGNYVGHVIVNQDNLTYMALIKQGGPGSERSRHIHIRHFSVVERVANGEVTIEHLNNSRMHANVLTKHAQGAQFQREREGLAKWA